MPPNIGYELYVWSGRSGVMNRKKKFMMKKVIKKIVCFYELFMYFCFDN